MAHLTMYNVIVITHCNGIDIKPVNDRMSLCSHFFTAAGLSSKEMHEKMSNSVLSPTKPALPAKPMSPPRQTATKQELPAAAAKVMR